ncbi:cadherin-22 [Syngnathoides biaculeatus]|uniref:cadherin-22 n=1 Tax=Syngnathoides biaculeatus TaxID=300417 RepID=UPI002ADD8BC3|nr:cadherin-22 [Syngnathoides biaculeatus]XP_061688047.1 cadherin-22 [Syngnathoides biaculeatus]XP_061688048.1 cadherin-22 [Syngnathoides biaculeatus]XP_061688049.1 cadherin-22 [Syngnathoides biaculeatus]XP_061688050.1 cadherin-22 [Syngnathoides biaculeatus]
MATLWKVSAWTLLAALSFLRCWCEASRPSGSSRGKQGASSVERVKRGWVWNQFFVVEEYTGTEPLYVGKIHTDSDEGEGNIKYTISGEGAGSIFIIDELTGDIHATERLDREEKAFYTLRALARDRLSDEPLEPESEFVIKVQDINDSEPKFLDGPYIGSVAELSPIGTSVLNITASDADDPSYGSSARVVYSVLDGEKFFTVGRHTGIIMTAVADLDRETQDRYELVVKATDMAGQMGGLSGSTTVTIVITDVNDNPPRFPQKMYQFTVSEDAAVGTPVGRVIATDADMGENTDMSYLIQEGGDLFKVTTDALSQEAVVSIKKPLDFESKRTHNVVVEAVNKHVDPRFVDLGSFRDQTIVRVSVSDVDEPPLFQPVDGAVMEVQEDAKVGALVGVVSARDPDVKNKPVRFSIDRSTDQSMIFHIHPDSGAITLDKILDRETAGWHNITVTAVEADNHTMASHSGVSIRILDVNDNPPELATPYEAFICEDAQAGKIIHTISVVDKDEPQPGHHFYFTLAPGAPSNRHFNLWDVKDTSAGIRTERSGFKRHEQNVYFLPIQVVDSTLPSHSSTGTLTIHICGCDPEGAIQSCDATAYVMSAALSPGALIALLVCMLILIVLVLLILTLKRHRKGQRIAEDEEDMRDNVIKYNDEGGGEQDTQAYDMSALRNLYDFPEAKIAAAESGLDIRSLPQWLQANRLAGRAAAGAAAAESCSAADFSLFKGYIRKKVEQADADLSVPPYDSFQTYAFEGTSSPALSLSSIHTLSTTSEQDFSYLSDWGPRFRQLAGYYAPGKPDEDGS